MPEKSIDPLVAGAVIMSVITNYRLTYVAPKDSQWSV